MICGQENQKILKEIRLIIGSQIQNQGLLHHFKTRILNIMIMPALDLPQKIVLLNLWTQKWYKKVSNKLKNQFQQVCHQLTENDLMLA